MATKLGDAYVEIGSRLGLLTSGLARAKGMVTGAMGAIAGTVGRAMDAMKRAAGIGGLGLAGAAGLGVKKFADFEEAMAKVATMLSRETMPLMGALTRQIRALSKEFGVSAESMASALFDVISAGFKADEAMSLLRQSARLATAGFTSTDTAMSALLTTMKAFGVGTERAGEVADMMFGIMKSGRVTFEDFAQNVGQVAGTAAMTGVRLSEMGAVLSQVINVTGMVSESFTRVRALIDALSAPTVRVRKHLKAFGVELGSARLAAEGMLPMIAELQRFPPEVQRQLLGSIEAMQALRAVDLGIIAKDLEKIRRSGGSVEEALAKAMDTVAFKMRRLKQQVNDTLRSIGGFFVNLWNEVSSDLRAVGAVLWAAWAKPLQRIAGAAGNLVETIRKLFLRAWDAVLERLVNIDIPLRKVLAIVRAGWREIGVGMQWVEDSLKTLAANVWMLIKQTVRVIWAALKPLGLAIMLAISKAAMTMHDALFRASRETSGFAASLLSGLGRAFGEVSVGIAKAFQVFPQQDLLKSLVWDTKEAGKEVKAIWDTIAAAWQKMPRFPGGRLGAGARGEIEGLAREAEARLERFLAARAAGRQGGGAARVFDEIIAEIKRLFEALKMPEIAGKLATAVTVAPSGLFAPRVPAGLERWGAAGDESVDLLRKIERNTRRRQGGLVMGA